MVSTCMHVCLGELLYVRNSTAGAGKTPGERTRVWGMQINSDSGIVGGWLCLKPWSVSAISRGHMAVGAEIITKNIGGIIALLMSALQPLVSPQSICTYILFGSCNIYVSTCSKINRGRLVRKENMAVTVEPDVVLAPILWMYPVIQVRHVVLHVTVNSTAPCTPRIIE